MNKVAPSRFDLMNWIRRATAATVIAGFVPAACCPLALADERPAVQRTDAVTAWIKQLDADAHAERKAAADGLANLGADAKPAVGKLTDVLHDEHGSVRAAAARALWLIDGQTTETVPALTELLVFGEPQERQMACYVLGTMGQPAAPALPALRKAMKSNSSTLMRVYAAEAVSQIDTKDTEAVNALITALSDKDAEARSVAATSLGNVPAALSDRVSPALVKALSDQDERVKAAAEVSLMNFHHEDDETQTAETESALFTDPAPAGEPATAKIGNPFAMLEAEPEPPQPVEVTKEAATEPEAKKPTPAKSVKIIPAVPVVESQPSVEPVAQPEPIVPQSVLETQSVHPELRQAVANLADPNPKVRQEAAIKISWFGSQAASIAPSMLQYLGDDNEVVCAHIAKAVYDADPALAEHAVATLTDLLDSVHPGIRPLSAYFLGQIGTPAKPALPALRRVAKVSEGMDQLHIAESIAHIDPTDSWPVDVLVKALNDPNADVRLFASFALTATAPHHSERVVPALLAATEDQNEGVRTAADMALGAFPLPSDKDLLAQFSGSQPSAEGRAAFEPQPNALNKDVFAQIQPPAPVDVVVQPSASPVDDLGDDRMKPITSLTANIAPRMRDDQGKRQQLPANYGARYLAGKGQVYSPRGASRPWMITAVQYAASGVCHRPLYFEEVNLERYGHNWCVLQPAVSAAAFFGRVPIIPYMIGAEDPCECQYDLGYYRPGSCAPFQKHCMPWSIKGGLLQAAATTGLAYVIY